MFTPRNGNARELLKQGKFLKDIKRKLCANKGFYKCIVQSNKSFTIQIIVP